MENLHTPPDTLAVRKNLLRTNISHRAILADNYANVRPNQGVDTPVFTGTNAGFEAGVAPSVHADAQESLADIILYKNPALSLLVVLVGSFALTTSHYIISGEHNMTFLSAICYLLLGELAINFTRSVFSSNPSSAGRWQGSGIVTTALETSATMVNYAASLHDQLLTMENPALALRVGGALWAVAVIGKYFSIWTLAAVGFAVTFTLPYAVYTHHEVVSALYSSALGAVSSRWKALGLSRKQQAVGLVAMVCAVWIRISWSNRLVGVLMGALAVRCNLKPAEVAALREHAAPLTMSVKKRAARISLAASDFANRTLGNKGHYRY